MVDQRIVVKGYKEFLRACAKADIDTRRFVRAELRTAGEVVRKDAQARLRPLSSISAAGYRVRVRQQGVAVEQSLRKVTGDRPDWGDTQMKKALLPVRDAKEGEVENLFQGALNRIAARFEGRTD